MTVVMKGSTAGMLVGLPRKQALVHSQLASFSPVSDPWDTRRGRHPTFLLPHNRDHLPVTTENNFLEPLPVLSSMSRVTDMH